MSTVTYGIPWFSKPVSISVLPIWIWHIIDHWNVCSPLKSGLLQIWKAEWNNRYFYTGGL